MHSESTDNGSRAARLRKQVAYACLCLSFLLVVALVLRSGIGARGQSLQSDSKVIWEPSGNATLMGYDWLSQTQLVWIIEQRRGRFEMGILDLETGAMSVLSQGTSELRKARIRAGEIVRVSPDGAWVCFSGAPHHSGLVSEETAATGAKLFVFNRLDSTIASTPFSASERPVCWFVTSDGVSSLVQFTNFRGGCEARVLDPREMSHVRTITLPFTVPHPVAFRQDQDCFVFPQVRGDNEEICRFRLLPDTPLRIESIPLIRNRRHYEPAFSQDGWKLGWVERSVERIPRPRRSGSPFALDFSRQTVYELFVLDLADKRIQAVAASFGETAIENFKFAPGARYISYVKGRGLYLVDLHNHLGGVP